MNRKASSLISLGISTALIAAVNWLLFYFTATPRGRFEGWHFPRLRWMMGGGGMGIIMLIFWIMVLAAAVPPISGTSSNRGSVYDKHTKRPSLDILKQRQARGEIDQETYLAVKRELLL